MSLAVTALRSGALGFWVRLNHHLVLTKQLFTGSPGPHFPTVFWTNSLCCHSIKRNRLVHVLNAHDELMQWTRPEPNFIWTPLASIGRSELIFFLVYWLGLPCDACGILTDRRGWALFLPWRGSAAWQRLQSSSWTRWCHWARPCHQSVNQLRNQSLSNIESWQLIQSIRNQLENKKSLSLSIIIIIVLLNILINILFSI